MKKLPVLISVPHSGLEIPEEVRHLNVLSLEDIVADGDEGASEIYSFPDRVAAYVTTPVARAFVDMNRAEDDFRKDGVVKTHTCWGVPIYNNPLSHELTESLIVKYHRPYHRALDDEYTNEILLGVDCHTMAVTGPPIGPDSGRERPLICLSAGEESCPKEIFISFARCLEKSFGTAVSLNKPFKGGYITRAHGKNSPWLQLELSRTDKMTVARKKEGVLRALEFFCESQALRA